MIIGIDASRAYAGSRTGTENYSYHVINELLRLPEAKFHTFVLFIRPNAIIPSELDGYDNVIVKNINWKYLWTQVGLAWATWQDPQIEVLWIPAHTLPVLRNPRIKTVVTIHGLEYQWLPEYKNLLQRWYLPLSTIYATKQANRIIAVSKFTANQLQKDLHTDTKKITVIYEGVDIRQSESSEIQSFGKSDNQIYRRYGLQDNKYVLFVGTIQPRKNLVALIEAFAIFAKQYPDYKLVIAGSVGWMAQEVMRAPQIYHVQDKVVFTGRVGEVELRELYAQARLYVQPSITEGFGLPVLEAMENGVPVISSDGGALREVVGEAGIVVSLRKAKFAWRLARAISEVIGDNNLQKKLITRGFDRVKDFGWDRTAKMTLSVLTGEGYNVEYNNKS